MDKGQWSDRRWVLEAELPVWKVRPGRGKGLGRTSQRLRGAGADENFDGRVFQAVEQQVPGVSTKGVAQIAGGQSTGVTGPATNTHQVPLPPPQEKSCANSPCEALRSM